MKTIFLNTFDREGFDYFLNEYHDMINIYKLHPVDFRTIDFDRGESRFYDFLAYCSDESTHLFIFVDSEGYPIYKSILEESCISKKNLSLIHVDFENQHIFLDDFYPFGDEKHYTEFSIFNKRGLDYIYSLAIADYMLEQGKTKIAILFERTALKSCRYLDEEKLIVYTKYQNLRRLILENNIFSVEHNMVETLKIYRIIKHETPYFRRMKLLVVNELIQYGIKIHHIFPIDTIVYIQKQIVNLPFLIEEYELIDQYFQLMKDYLIHMDDNTNELKRLLLLEHDYRKPLLLMNLPDNNVEFAVSCKLLADYYISINNLETANSYLQFSLDTLEKIKNEKDYIDVYKIVESRLKHLQENNKREDVNENESKTIDGIKIMYTAKLKSDLILGRVYKVISQKMFGPDMDELEEMEYRLSQNKEFIYLISQNDNKNKLEGILCTLKSLNDEFYIQTIAYAQLKNRYSKDETIYVIPPTDKTLQYNSKVKDIMQGEITMNEIRFFTWYNEIVRIENIEEVKTVFESEFK